MSYLLQRPGKLISWRRHDMERLSVSLAFCEGNLQVATEFPTQVMQIFDISFVPSLNKL